MSDSAIVFEVNWPADLARNLEAGDEFPLRLPGGERYACEVVEVRHEQSRPRATVCFRSDDPEVARLIRRTPMIYQPITAPSP